MVGEQVLPVEFQVYCDAFVETAMPIPICTVIIVYDDEGVKARRVDNVVNGVLKEFLMSRIPLGWISRQVTATVVLPAGETPFPGNRT